jgi:hypothetical protein
VTRGGLIHPTVIKVVSDSRSSNTPYCNKGSVTRGVLIHSTVIKVVSDSRSSYIHPTVIKVVSDSMSSLTFITVGCIRTPRVIDNLYYSRVYKNSSSH